MIAADLVLGTGRVCKSSVNFIVPRPGDFEWSVMAMCDSYAGWQLKNVLSCSTILVNFVLNFDDNSFYNIFGGKVVHAICDCWRFLETTKTSQNQKLCRLTHSKYRSFTQLCLNNSMFAAIIVAFFFTNLASPGQVSTWPVTFTSEGKRNQKWIGRGFSVDRPWLSFWTGHILEVLESKCLKKTCWPLGEVTVTKYPWQWTSNLEPPKSVCKVSIVQTLRLIWRSNFRSRTLKILKSTSTEYLLGCTFAKNITFDPKRIQKWDDCNPNIIKTGRFLGEFVRVLGRSSSILRSGKMASVVTLKNNRIIWELQVTYKSSTTWVLVFLHCDWGWSVGRWDSKFLWRADDGPGSGRVSSGVV